MNSFTGALKSHFLLFQQFSSKKKVIKEDTESISRVLYKFITSQLCSNTKNLLFTFNKKVNIYLVYEFNGRPVNPSNNFSVKNR